MTLQDPIVAAILAVITTIAGALGTYVVVGFFRMRHRKVTDTQEALTATRAEVRDDFKAIAATLHSFQKETFKAFEDLRFKFSQLDKEVSAALAAVNAKHDMLHLSLERYAHAVAATDGRLEDHMAQMMVQAGLTRDTAGKVDALLRILDNSSILPKRASDGRG